MRIATGQPEQDALVRKGLAEMRKGRVVTHEEVVKRLKSWPANSRAAAVRVGAVLLFFQA